MHVSHPLDEGIDVHLLQLLCSLVSRFDLLSSFLCVLVCFVHVEMNQMTQVGGLCSICHVLCHVYNADDSYHH